MLRTACIATLLAATAAAPLPAAAQDAAALRAFEALAGGCKAAYERQLPRDVLLNERTGQWVQRAFSPARVTYDVQRTTSLVTPFTGTIRVSQAVKTARAGTEAEARALTVAIDDQAVLIVDVLGFSYQQGQWVLQGSETSMESGTTPTRVRRSAADIRAAKGTPVAECAGPY